MPGALDVARMRRERLARLQREMEAAAIDGLVLLGLSNVQYAVGPRVVTGDQSHAFAPRAVAIVPAAGPPHLCTPWPEGAPPELPSDHVHAPADVDSGAGADALLALARDLLGASSTIAFDEHTTATYFRGARDTFVDAMPVLAAAKLRKTPDELECIRRAQAINEAAMDDVRPHARPGVRQIDLSARFLRLVCELGATANAIDPIWQVVTPSIADGPFTTTGHVAYPVPSTDRILREGDVVWVDTGITYVGYASDFGRTWIVGDPPRPTARQRDQFRRWREVIDRVLAVIRPGATGADLTRAACDGLDERPWLPHFYLAHGVGTDSAEMPLIGTDLGDAFDESLVLAPGMVLVLEPVIWDDGHAGYRSEEIVAVTDDGWVPLSDHTYAPFT
jgi:Xaa-Pro aminopeptidase